MLWNEGIGPDDDQRLLPAFPYSGEPNPEESICIAQAPVRMSSLQDGELLWHGQVFEG
jgi:hypothetical protein